MLKGFQPPPLPSCCVRFSGRYIINRFSEKHGRYIINMFSPPIPAALCGLFCPSDVPAGISPPGSPSARFPPSCGSCGLFPAGIFLPLPPVPAEAVRIAPPLPRFAACFAPQTFRRGFPRPEVPPPVFRLPAAPVTCFPPGSSSRCPYRGQEKRLPFLGVPLFPLPVAEDHPSS